MRQVYVVCERNTYKYFCEYLDNLCFYFPDFIYNTIIYSTESNLLKQLKGVSNALIITVRHLPKALNRPSDNIIVYLNTEQCVKQLRTDEHGQSFQSIICDFYDAVIDYSFTNIRNLKRSWLNTNYFYLPYLYSPKEDIYECSEVRHRDNIPRKIDVGMIPINSKRRENIYQKLKHELPGNRKVRRLSGFGKERDENLSRCKIVVNVHIEKEYNILETMRCHRLLYDNIIVISETSRDFSIDHHLNKHIIFTDYDNIFDTVSDVLEDYDYYHHRIFEDFDAEKYKEIEKQIASNFVKEITAFVEMKDKEISDQQTSMEEEKEEVKIQDQIEHNSE